MSTTGSPIVDDMIQPFKRGAKRVSEFMEHPVDSAMGSIKEMLGISPQAPPVAAPPPDTSWHDQKTREAMESFQPKPKMLPRMK